MLSNISSNFMKPRTIDRLDRLVPNWGAVALVAFVTLTLTVLFFA